MHDTRGQRRSAGRSSRGHRPLPWSAAFALVCLLASLAVAGPAATPAVAAGVPGPVPTGEWSVEDPVAHGMDPAVLDQARAYAFTPGKNTQGVVVVQRGAIVGEWYAPGAGPTSWAASWSMAKSINSALIGIAIGEGKIPSVDVPMSTFFPDWAGTPKGAITLRDVLHMESGLQWNEDYDPTSLGSSDIIQMVALEADQLAFAASRPVAHPPGTSFNYSSGDAMLLGEVVHQATGMRADEYARQKLFGPIGMSPVDWWRDAANHTLTYCCVDTPSRSFARFGLLYLRGGDWNGTQVVPASWVDASIDDHAKTYDGYGYQWWLNLQGAGSVPPFFSAQGHDGQFIYVIPSLDLVVVRNGTYAKSPCEPVADPNLLYHYPPSGLVPGQGTTPPDSWNDVAFLEPIVASFDGGGGGSLSTRSAASVAREPATGLAGARSALADPAPCPTSAPPTTSTTTTPVPGAVPVTVAATALTPSFTG